ncbi:MAG: hypothetical protein A2031_04590 [Deltaproteobacteria bacterium RBG_19FT_COMBO_43_11]|nr:MAG: hypothetical protein A2031_04590 [Deltaproteobacteria bacterium RBG_19FT_COMBO_43_11]
MKKVMKVFIVAALLVFSTTAFAQIRPGAFNIGPLFGIGVFEGNQDLDNAPVLGLRGGYDFTKNWGVEATFNWVPTRYNYEIGSYIRQRWVGSEDSEHVNVYNYRIEAIYNFDLFPDKRFVPFVAVGIGGQTIDYRGDNDAESDRTRFAPDYGVGLKYFLTENIAIRGDVRHVLAIGSIYNDLEATLGMAFYFGGKKEAPPVEEIKKAPAAVPEIEKKMMDEGRARINVEFDFDKSDVKAQYNDEIKQVADFMVKYPDTKVAIEGHTDSIGTNEYNQKLSQRRADSVKNYISDKFNIDSKRLKSEGYGETRPIADNKTAEGRQQNRRVESVLIKEDKK